VGSRGARVRYESVETDAFVSLRGKGREPTSRPWLIAVAFGEVWCVALGDEIGGRVGAALQGAVGTLLCPIASMRTEVIRLVDRALTIAVLFWHRGPT